MRDRHRARVPAPARAADADDLVARGEELAKQGEWTRTITAFKSGTPSARAPSTRASSASRTRAGSCRPRAGNGELWIACE